MSPFVETLSSCVPISADDSGTFAIYGSKKEFNYVDRTVHYSNVLVLYNRTGHVIGIYSGETVPGGNEELSDLNKIFLGLLMQPLISK